MTDELVGDAGVNFPGSYDGVSFTSLISEDLDAKEVSSVKDAKSLPGVGIGPFGSASLYPALAAVPVLVLSARAGAGDLVRARGPLAFLPKPFDVDDLLRVVEDLLA